MESEPSWSPVVRPTIICAEPSQKWYEMRKSQGYTTGADIFLTATFDFSTIKSTVRLIRGLCKRECSSGDRLEAQIAAQNVSEAIREWDRKWIDMGE